MDPPWCDVNLSFSGERWLERDQLIDAMRSAWKASATNPGNGNGDNLCALSPALAASHLLSNSLERRARSAEAGQPFRFGNPVRAALAGDPNQEVTEGVIEPLDVSEHARMGADGWQRRPCSAWSSAGTGCALVSLNRGPTR